MKLKHIICLFAIIGVAACYQNSDKAVVLKENKKDLSVKKAYPLTDSAQLMLHLDSLPKVSFPYLSEINYNAMGTLSLAVFKNKVLLHVPITLIPSKLEGANFDHAADLDEHGILPASIKETTNLADTINHYIKAVFVAAKPKFVVIDFNGTLATLSYNARVIDAIYSAKGYGWGHWSVQRNTTVKKDLTMIVHDTYTPDITNALPAHDDVVNENWYIDNTGHFQKKADKTKPKR